ncbi:MAG: hypothetical protein U0W24_08880 [Bacteroidales bacterium]
MELSNQNKLNSDKIGIALGLILPLTAIIVYYIIESPGSLGLFFKEVFIYGIHTKVIGLTIIPNFVIYFIARLKKLFKLSEGISIISLVYLVIIVVLKYLT